MKKLLAILLTGMIFSSVYATDLQKLSDKELDGIYAQGFTLNGQIFDNPVLAGNTESFSYGVGVGDIQIEGGAQFNLDSSLMLSGNAQQNAFIPINIVDSAVNIPINIVVIMGDNYGNVNIKNLLKSFNKTNITGGM